MDVTRYRVLNSGKYFFADPALESVIFPVKSDNMISPYAAILLASCCLINARTLEWKGDGYGTDRPQPFAEHASALQTATPTRTLKFPPVKITEIPSSKEFLGQLGNVVELRKR